MGASDRENEDTISAKIYKGGITEQVTFLSGVFIRLLSIIHYGGCLIDREPSLLASKNL